MKNKKSASYYKKERFCRDASSQVQKTYDEKGTWVSALTNCANEARWINISTCDIDYNFCTVLVKVLVKVLLIGKKNVRWQVFAEIN